MKQLLLRNYFWVIFFVYALSGCSRAPFIEPGIGDEKPAARAAPADTVGEVAPSPAPPESSPPAKPSVAAPQPEDELDFSLAFVDSAATDDDRAEIRSEKQQPARLPIRKKRILPLKVPSQMARIALRKNVAKAILYSLGNVDIKTKGLDTPRGCRGRIVAEASRLVANEAVIRTTQLGKLRVALPCTLLARSSGNFFEFEEVSYRGSIILSKGNAKSIAIINLLDVEDYLRGVVPLEIGKRSTQDIEAVKAQAVAARTYTYRRIIERTALSYDLLPDVSDQVYGGVNVEQSVCDQAIRLTGNIVITYDDSVILAYYHSTCGGRTANVEDVWNKPPQPYLISRPDTEANGKAYCSISRYYQWDESWTKKQLSSIISHYSRTSFPAKPVPRGTITGMKVVHRYTCGRIGACVIITNDGSYRYGGDKIRFLLRRNAKNNPILRSSRFEVTGSSGERIVLKGYGYGHGVGMCQMGAIGRARAGQTYEQILRAYYSGIALRRVEGRVE